MNFSELKQQYDCKTVQEVENDVNEFASISTDYYRRQIGALFYLERTGKFRESAGFKGADFDTYLREKWNMSPSKYRDAKTAYIQFPEESEEYGAGFMANVARKCGQANVATVLNALDSEKKKSKKPLTPEKRDAILKRFIPTHQIKKEYVDWRAMYLQAQQTIKEMQGELEEKEVQIEKLKRTLESYRRPRPPESFQGQPTARA